MGLLHMEIATALTWMHQCPPEWIGFATFVFCSGCILALHAAWGATGLQVYICTALWAGNIQVLKATQYAFFENPIVLGTVVYTSTLLAMEMLVEFHGPAQARRAIGLGFASCLVGMGMMGLAMGVRPLAVLPDSPYVHFVTAHQAMVVLFTPIPQILFASWIAYLVSQWVEIGIYQTLRVKTQGRALWLRTGVAHATTAFLDNVLFSTLAWVIFAPKPVDGHTLWWVYILGTYTIRLAVSGASIPIMYLARSITSPLPVRT